MGKNKYVGDKVSFKKDGSGYNTGKRSIIKPTWESIVNDDNLVPRTFIKDEFMVNKKKKED